MSEDEAEAELELWMAEQGWHPYTASGVPAPGGMCGECGRTTEAHREWRLELETRYAEEVET